MNRVLGWIALTSLVLIALSLRTLFFSTHLTAPWENFWVVAALTGLFGLALSGIGALLGLFISQSGELRPESPPPASRYSNVIRH